MSERRRPGALALAAGFYALLAGAGAFWMRARGDPFPDVLLATRVRPGVALLLGVNVALAILVVSESWLARFDWTRALRHDVARLFAPLTPSAALTLALLSGIGEEVLFRGALLPWCGLWLSSLAFGLLHTDFGRRMLGWTAFACAGGVAFGGLFCWTGGLLAPVVAHGVVNGVQLVRLAREEARERALGRVAAGDPL